MAEDNKLQGLGWFLAGLGVGALLGVLYAPKSGRETREDLASGAREGAEFLKDRGRRAVDEVGTLVDRSREQVGEYVGRGRAQWEEFVERGKNLVNEQSARVNAAFDAGRQAYHSSADQDEPYHREG